MKKMREVFISVPNPSEWLAHIKRCIPTDLYIENTWGSLPAKDIDRIRLQVAFFRCASDEELIDLLYTDVAESLDNYIGQVGMRVIKKIQKRQESNCCCSLLNQRLATLDLLYHFELYKVNSHAMQRFRGPIAPKRRIRNGRKWFRGVAVNCFTEIGQHSYER